VVLLLQAGTSAPGYAQDVKPAAVPGKAPVHVMRPSRTPSGALHAPFQARVTARPNLTPVNTGTGIVFTCDPSVTAATCTYLNTTVAGWYNDTFTDANAAIYIQYGTTGLAESTTGFYNFVTYDQYVAALTSNKSPSAIQTSALSALSTNDAKYYASDNVSINGPLGAALGFAGLNGTTVGGVLCTLPSAGCYDGIITVTNDPSTPLYYDNLGGAEPSDAYDFYGVVAHETDEVLGTSSCIGTQNSSGLVDNCDAGASVPSGTGTPSAVDLYRYSSAGNLVLDSSLSTAPGAYFSYNGGSTNGANGKAGTPKVYNTLDNGDDYADFLSSLPDCGTNIAVQDAEGCPGEDAGLSILNDGGGEINILNTVGYDVPSTVSAPLVKLSTTSIAFGNQTVDTTSSPMQVTLTNTGNATLDITSIVVTGADPSSFAFPDTCGTTLTAGSHCTLSGTFDPVTTGPLSASLTFTDNAAGSPQAVSLSGTGVAVVKQTQTITFNPIPSQVQGTKITLSATASSGLPVSFTSLTTTFCTVSGTTATLVSPGICTIQATQAGNTQYAAATPVKQSFTVTSASAASFTITAIPLGEFAYRGEIEGFFIELQSVNGFNGNVTLSCSGGPAGSSCTDFPMSVHVNGKAYALSGVFFSRNTAPGTYTIAFKGVSGSLTESTTAKFTVK
jgi:hypothetical protein